MMCEISYLGITLKIESNPQEIFTYSTIKLGLMGRIAWRIAWQRVSIPSGSRVSLL